MKLIDDASSIWHQLWSVRLSLLSGIASTADAVWEAYLTGQPPWALIVTALISFASAASRVVVQDKLPGRSDG